MYDIPLYHYVVINHSVVQGYLVCCEFLDIMNSDAVNILVYVS